MTSIRKLLVANRGEIAVRIFQTAREMGLDTVAVYSDLDRSAPHVTQADEAYHIGPPSARESYLNLDRIMEVASMANVDAIHPGYGFLSEHPEFPRRCQQAGICFVGPSSSAIERAGNKINARQMADTVGVPTVPGQVLSNQDVEEARDIGQEIGFPVLIKAAAGGGGKGMRVVEEEEEFDKAFREARREAQNAFNNPDVFIEKYFSRPRHIEVQIMADRHGNVVHFGERECSIQRRHQKLIEESPSPIVDTDLREKMGRAAVRFAREAEYTNAGTVEFLVDSEQEFYFLEINTRLQVEHPVTEMVTGIDLVREQLRVARGEPLGYATEDISFRGWAMECRICAEDPASGFTPSTGTIRQLSRPGGPFTRFDVGVDAGSELTMHYDSLIGKLICRAKNRDQVIDRLKRALEDMCIVGIRTTIPFFLDVLDDESFRNGNITTRYLDGYELASPEPEQVRTVATLAAVMRHMEKASYSFSGDRSATDNQGSSNWFTQGMSEVLSNGS